MRLQLRPPVVADAPALFASYVQDPEVARYMEWRAHRDITETREFLRRCETVWNQQVAYPWVVILKDSSDLIGMAEIRVRGHTVNVGYVLARAFWGNGYATEALLPIMDWAFDQPSIHRVWATCDIDNVKSARVLERLGMQREGVLRRWIVHPNVSTEPRDSLCYARVRE